MGTHGCKSLSSPDDCHSHWYTLVVTMSEYKDTPPSMACIRIKTYVPVQYYGTDWGARLLQCLHSVCFAASCGATMTGWLEISFYGPATPDDKTFQFGPKASCVNRNQYACFTSKQNVPRIIYFATSLGKPKSIKLELGQFKGSMCQK